MSSEILRRAAALMRERAEAVPPEGLSDCWFDAEASDLMHLRSHDREHIASWSPAVAFAVADWLDREVEWADIGAANSPQPEALAVARAYLGAA